MQTENKYLCKTCYRIGEKNKMVILASGIVSDMCLVCRTILGKGYGATGYSQKEEEEWFEDMEERKKIAKENNLL